MFLNNFLTILKNISNLENPHHNHVHQHYHQIPSIADDDDASDDCHSDLQWNKGLTHSEG